MTEPQTSVFLPPAPVVCIAGPTASGKTGLAVELARLYGGEVVNADSQQVYADLPILTATPTVAEQSGIPHHLFGHVDGARRYSVGDWLRDAMGIIRPLIAAGTPVVLVGGTGLYFKALTEGLAQIPAITTEARAFGAALAQAGEGDLRAEAEKQDPIAAARILPGDRQRLRRVVEVALSTGRPLSDWQADTKPALDFWMWRSVVINPARDALLKRIEARAHTMWGPALLEEVSALLARGLDPVLPVMKVIGMPDFAARAPEFDDNRDALLEALIIQTRRYAKRQRTWFRGQCSQWPQLESSDVQAAHAAFGEPVDGLQVPPIGVSE